MLSIDLSRQHLYPFLLPEGGAGTAHVCEIGVQDGYNAERLWNAVFPAQLYLVDIWEAHDQVRRDGTVMTAAQNPRLSTEYGNAAYDRTCQRFASPLAQGQVTMLRMPSTEGAAHVPDLSLDFVYIDALHTFEHCYADLIHWHGKVKQDGFILGHDLFHVGVNDAILRFLRETGWHFLCLTKEHSPTYILCRDPLSANAVALRRKFYEAGVVEFRINGNVVPIGQYENAYIAGRRYSGSLRLDLRYV